MPDLGANDVRARRSEGPMLNATALRSTKAGLLALGIVSFALATFGPWFNLLIGYGLMIASVAVAVLCLWWGGRLGSGIRRSHRLSNGDYPKSGATLSCLSFFPLAYHTRFLGVIFFATAPLFFGLF